MGEWLSHPVNDFRGRTLPEPVTPCGYVQRRVKELGEAVTLQVNLPESTLWKRLPNDANFTAFADLIGGRSATVADKT